MGPAMSASSFAASCFGLSVGAQTHARGRQFMRRWLKIRDVALDPFRACAKI
jgi:hypothetical protein